MFFRSLDAAIFLFSRVARLPLGSAVVPAISTEERITLGAELADGSRLRGQNNISHPPAPSQSRSQIVEKDCTLLAPPFPPASLLPSPLGEDVQHGCSGTYI